MCTLIDGSYTLKLLAEAINKHNISYVESSNFDLEAICNECILFINSRCMSYNCIGCKVYGEKIKKLSPKDANHHIFSSKSKIDIQGFINDVQEIKEIQKTIKYMGIGHG